MRKDISLCEKVYIYENQTQSNTLKYFFAALADWSLLIISNLSNQYFKEKTKVFVELNYIKLY